MKQCPFCAEDVQDNAVKCKHCGENLPDPSIKIRKRRPLRSALIASIVFSLLFFAWAILARNFSYALAGLCFIPIGAIAWSIGDVFRRFASPDAIFSTGAFDMAKQKLFWIIGPQLVSIFIAWYGTFALVDMMGEKKGYVQTPLPKVDNVVSADTGQSTKEAAILPVTSLPEPVKDTAVLVDSASQAADTTQAPVTPVAETVQTNAKESPSPRTSADHENGPTASFDCSLARSRVEKLICSNNEVASADSHLASVYANSLRVVSDKNEARQDQKQWITSTRDSCLSTECLLDAYKARIEVLIHR